MKDLRRIVLIVFLIPLIALMTSCGPCRRVLIQSQPSGAAIYLSRPDLLSPRDFPEGAAGWRYLGRTPLRADSCALRDGLKASWEKQELFLPDYDEQRKINFDFARGEVTF